MKQERFEFLVSECERGVTFGRYEVREMLEAVSDGIEYERVSADAICKLVDVISHLSKMNAGRKRG